MARATLRKDLAGHKVPAYSVKEGKHIYLDLSGRTLEVYTCDEEVLNLEDYNAIVIVAGECYLINTIEVDFLEE